MDRFGHLLVENAFLRNQISSYTAEIEKLQGRFTYQDQMIKHLEDALRLLRMKKFAPTSEKFVSEEQMIFNEIEVLARQSQDEEEKKITVKEHKKGVPKRRKLPEDLPREKVTVELPQDERKCPFDETELKVVGSEVSERLDVIPLQMKVIETHRLTYACPCCQSFMRTAGAKPSLIPKGIPTAGTLSFIATSKFCDGLSLYHLEKIFLRNQVEMSRTSMASWMIRAQEQSQPLLNLLEEELLLRDYVQIDETPVQVLKEPGKKPQTLSYMWVRTSPLPEKPIVLFDYDPTRSGKVAERLLEEFRGRLQCDGFSGYDRLEQKPHIIRHGCMAHVRRKYFEATKGSKKATLGKQALELIQKLYAIEERVRGKPPNEIYGVRQEESVPILEELKVLVEENISRVPPKSLTGKALLYTKNEWPYISRYVEDGRVHIDNNYTENKIRPFAVGRRRWLFCATVAGAHASAGMYSLVETAKANNCEPYKYLRHIFEELPKATTLQDYERLLPWNFKTSSSPETANQKPDQSHLSI